MKPIVINSVLEDHSNETFHNARWITSAVTGDPWLWIGQSHESPEGAADEAEQFSAATVSTLSLQESPYFVVKRVNNQTVYTYSEGSVKAVTSRQRDDASMTRGGVPL